MAGASFTVVSPGNVASAILGNGQGQEHVKAARNARLEPRRSTLSGRVFRGKSGLSLKAAKVILHANRQSQMACDAAARAFLAALKLRGRS